MAIILNPRKQVAPSKYGFGGGAQMWRPGDPSPYKEPEQTADVLNPTIPDPPSPPPLVNPAPQPVISSVPPAPPTGTGGGMPAIKPQITPTPVAPEPDPKDPKIDINELERSERDRLKGEADAQKQDQDIARFSPVIMTRTEEQNRPPQTRPQTQTQTPRTTKPPPAPSGGGQTNDRVNQMWERLYGQPTSRYDSDLVQRGMKVIEDSIARMRQTGMRNLGEHFASRGLTGSSLEGFGVSDLEGELARYGDERSFNLGREMANTWAQDRSTEGNLGLGIAGLGRGSENDAWNQAFSNWNAEQGYARQDRSQDQNEMSLIASLVDRFGPEVLEQLGITSGGGTRGGTYF